MISIFNHEHKGRTLVATVPIAAKTLLEKSFVLVIPSVDRPVVDSTVVFTYIFSWEDGLSEQDLYKHTGNAAIALGVTSLLCHSYTPNASITKCIKDNVIELWSTKDIHPGEEITIDYGMDLWFNVAE